MRIAIFDFDGTLYAKETFQILMDRLKNHPVYHSKYQPFFRAILPRYIGYKLKLYPDHRMKARSMQIYIDAFDRLAADELDAFFQEMVGDMQKDFNKSVLVRLEQHAADGMHVMLVSGAYTPLVQATTKGLPIDTIIGTDIPMRNGQIDPNKSLNYIQGMRKNEEILAAIKAEEIDWGNSFAYADSFSDLSVLELVGNPVAVQPEPRLQTIAIKRGWEVI